MNVAEQVDILGLRLEDAEKVLFTDSLKLTALGNAQVRLASMLHNNYLTELQFVKTSVTASGGVTATLNTALLDNEVLRGAEGIISVKDASSGLYCIKSTLEDAKRLENQFLEGTTHNPIYWIYQNKIYVRPTTVTSLDVSYLKVPTTLRYKFTSNAMASPNSGGFVGASGEGLSVTTDYYGGQASQTLDSIIYNVNKASYHVVTDYGGADLTFTVLPAATGSFIDGQTFYFVTNGFDLINLSGITTDLNESLHELMITLSEAECWAMDEQLNRRTSALNAAMDEIKTLNTRYTEAVGVGTKGDGR